jgi:hypothetical protein
MENTKRRRARESAGLGMKVVQRVGRLAKALVLATLCCVVQTRSPSGPEVPRPHDADFGSLASLAPVRAHTGTRNAAVNSLLSRTSVRTARKLICRVQL